MKAVSKIIKEKNFLLTLKLRLFRSYVKGEYSVGKEFQRLGVQGKQLLKQTSLQHQGMMREDLCKILE